MEYNDLIKILSDTKTLNNWDINWLKKYRCAYEYYIENGNLLVPTNYSIKIDGEIIRLGSWIRNQRINYDNKSISKEKIILLESIEMIWQLKTEKWDEMYEYALNYYEEYGNLLIPLNYSIKREGKLVRLGRWIQYQRIDYKNKTISEEQIRKLETISMVWNIRKSGNEESLLSEN